MLAGSPRRAEPQQPCMGVRARRRTSVDPRALRSAAAHVDRALNEADVAYATLRAGVGAIKTAADTAAETVERVLPPAAGSRCYGSDTRRTSEGARRQRWQATDRRRGRPSATCSGGDEAWDDAFHQVLIGMARSGRSPVCLGPGSARWPPRTTRREQRTSDAPGGSPHGGALTRYDSAPDFGPPRPARSTRRTSQPGGRSCTTGSSPSTRSSVCASRAT